MNSARTQTIVDLVPKNHPLSASMETAIVDALGTSEQFGGHKIALASDRRMTELGQRQALQEALTGNHGKALARANAPVEKARKAIDARHAALVVKPGPSNSAGAIGHAEIRTWLRSLDFGELQGIALATEDPDILHAMLLKPEMSGLVGLPVPVIAQIRDRYVASTYPGELAAIAADDAVVVPAEQAMHIARNEMRSTIDLHEIEFDALLKSIEPDRPVLTSDRKQIITIDAAGRASYRPASQSEIDNGVVYGSDEHKAAQAA
jgi:hypothetical protein